MSLGIPFIPNKSRRGIARSGKAHKKTTTPVVDAAVPPPDYSDTLNEPVDGHCRGGYAGILPGDSLHCGRYRAIKQLGWGYFSTVWLAWSYGPVSDGKSEAESTNTDIDRAAAMARSSSFVALKIAKSASDFHSAAVQEARLLSACAQCPGVVPLLDSFEHISPRGAHFVCVFPLCGVNLLRVSQVLEAAKLQVLKNVKNERTKKLDAIAAAACGDQTSPPPSVSVAEKSSPCSRVCSCELLRGATAPPSCAHTCSQVLVATVGDGEGSVSLPTVTVRSIAETLLNALSKLHDDHRLIHTDLKPENVLLATPSPAFLAAFAAYVPPPQHAAGASNSSAAMTYPAHALSRSQRKRRAQRLKQISAATAVAHNTTQVKCTVDDSDALEDAATPPVPSQSTIEPLPDVSVEDVLLGLQAGVAITDLGNAEFTRSFSAAEVATPQYRAPEVSFGCVHTPAIDIFALGCILFELVTGAVLFPCGDYVIEKKIESSSAERPCSGTRDVTIPAAHDHLALLSAVTSVPGFMRTPTRASPPAPQCYVTWGHQGERLDAMVACQHWSLDMLRTDKESYRKAVIGGQARTFYDGDGLLRVQDASCGNVTVPLAPQLCLAGLLHRAGLSLCDAFGLASVIRLCLVADPRARPSATQLALHPWILGTGKGLQQPCRSKHDLPCFGHPPTQQREASSASARDVFAWLPCEWWQTSRQGVSSMPQSSPQSSDPRGPALSCCDHLLECRVCALDADSSQESWAYGGPLLPARETCICSLVWR